MDFLTIAERDRALEELWEQFGDVPMDPDTEQIDDDFFIWPHGTDREDIWHWFDERHSKGVVYLLYHDGIDRTEELAQSCWLKSLRDMCFECETHDCAYNHEGICRYAMVHESTPNITEDDGCISGVTAFL